MVKNRYSLILPDEMEGQLKRLAEQEGTNRATLIRQFIKLGLMLKSDNPTLKLVSVKDGTERDVILL